MKEHTDRMDKSIKDKFEDHEVSVPSHLWNSIEANLPPDNNSNGGTFFFNKPFILSILVISTVIIGTYLYNTTDTQQNRAHSIANVTPVTAGSNGHTSVQSTNTSTNALKAGNHSEKDLASTVVASPYSENTSSAASLKNYKNTNSRNTVEFVPASVSYRAQAKNNSSNTVRQSAVNTNSQYIAAAGNNTTAAGSVTDSQAGVHPATTHTASQSTDNTYSSTSPSNQLNHPTSQTNNLASPSTSENLNSINSKHSNATYSTQSDNQLNNTNGVSLSKADNITGAINAPNIQDISKNTTENKLQKTVYADSIKQFTSAFMNSDSEQFNNSTVASGTSATSNAVPNSNTTNNTLAQNQNPDITASQISGSLVSLNAANTLSTPSDAASLHTNVRHADTAAAAHSIDRTASGANLIYSAINSNSVISANNKNEFANTWHPDSNATNNETVFQHATNYVTNEVFEKIDSTISVREIDSLTAKNLAKTTDVTTFDAQKKKSLFLSRCSFDGYVTPSFGYMHLSSNNPEDSLNNFKERNKNANTGFGLTSGLRMNYALTQKIEIGIGLQYSSLSQQSSFTQHHFDSSYYTYQTHTRIDSTYDSINHVMVYTPYLVRDSTYMTAFSDQVTTHTDKFQNISIPIHIAYGYSISNKFSLLARTSLLINYQIYSVTYLNTSNEIIGYHSNKNLSLGGSFSIGGYYQLSKACSVFAEPILSYYFQNVFDNQAPFKQTQLMLGLQTGIRLSF